MPERDRLEREINEILSHEPPLAPPSTPPALHVGRLASFARSAQLLLVACGLIFVGFLFDELLPFAGYWLVLAGAILFITSLAFMMFGKPPAHRG